MCNKIWSTQSCEKYTPRCEDTDQNKNDWHFNIPLSQLNRSSGQKETSELSDIIHQIDLEMSTKYSIQIPKSSNSPQQNMEVQN